MERLVFCTRKDVKLAMRIVKVFEKKFPCCVEYAFEDNQIYYTVWCLLDDKEQIRKAIDSMRYKR